MKNILVLSSSARKNGTGIDAVNLFKSHFDENEYGFEIVSLSEYNLNFCKGCTACFIKDGKACPCKDDVEVIVDKMSQAEGLIYVSPIYGMNISGTLKTFMDRTAYLYHKPEMIGKPVLFICSADVGGAKPMKIYMDYMFSAMAMRTLGAVGVLAGRFKSDEAYRERISEQISTCAQAMKLEINRESNPEPKFKELFHFAKWQTKHLHSKSIYPGDYRFWQERGWFESEYYYPTKINGLDRFKLYLLKRVLFKKVMKSI